ncbi:MAG: hypothetical protein QOJ15_10174 [Bradyrhizobium sp.]|jgi:hypothetical protein|nr:hypothetical protein [Bradyrhizobium sp.]
MVLKNVFATLVCTTLLAWSGLSIADEYRPDELLGLDLSSAALSPKPLGPPAQFAPGPLDVKVDRGGEAAPAPVTTEVAPNVAVRETSKVAIRETPKVAVRVTRPVHARAEKPRGVARTRLARRHGNPLDAEAFDTRIQVWPCRSGGICGWKR